MEFEKSSLSLLKLLNRLLSWSKQAIFGILKLSNSYYSHELKFMQRSTVLSSENSPDKRTDPTYMDHKQAWSPIPKNGTRSPDQIQAEKVIQFPQFQILFGGIFYLVKRSKFRSRCDPKFQSSVPLKRDLDPPIRSGSDRDRRIFRSWTAVTDHPW